VSLKLGKSLEIITFFFFLKRKKFTALNIETFLFLIRHLSSSYNCKMSGDVENPKATKMFMEMHSPNVLIQVRISNLDYTGMKNLENNCKKK